MSSVIKQTSFNIYPWQAKDWQHLTAYVKQERTPQALIINGVQGLGKELLALNYAQYLLCLNRQDNTACDQCDACKLFQAHTHPDFIVLEPEEAGKAIGVGLVRQLLTKLTLTPQYSAYRVVLINPADAMNINSANAFLKCLEEPPERTVMLLLTEQMQQLPATIMSRCQKLMLHSPDANIAKQWLQEQGVTNDQQLLLNLTQGAPLQALAYAQNDVLKLRKQCFEEWQNILSRHACPVSLAEQWLKLSAAQLLVWLISWTEDIIKCQFSAETGFLSNEDFAKHLHVLAKQLNLKQLFEFYRLLLQNQYRFQTPLNKQLLLEELLITWAKSTVST
ncbi:MAG: DNA polymerase III subunit delta' [Methyloprofundus sp.]|nr:DNA polymerase III subunit delta' [Methyloprofundus sp.]